MTVRKLVRILPLMMITLSMIAAGLFVNFQPASADEQSQGTEEYCLSCHSDVSLDMQLPSGEILSLYISPENTRDSVHSQFGIECQACHTQIDSYPHPPLEYTSHTELTQAFYLSCRNCHAENYDRALDSMHAEVAAAGNLDAPVCTTCHGAHDVRPPDQPRAHISEICGQCHTEIYDHYSNSVHGNALIAESNPDVPVCTDCHGVHNIQDPRTAQFRLESPDLCASCHADPELMDQYGLSADVYNIYQLSWHGVDVSIYKAYWPSIWHESAVCTDCHGVHAIFQTDDPRSQVNTQNLLETCRNCHPDAGPNWTQSWTGHNEISLERTPFVFYTQAFYASFTPVILWVVGIYVFLQILRVGVARVRRSLR